MDFKAKLIKDASSMKILHYLIAGKYVGRASLVMEGNSMRLGTKKIFSVG